MKPGIYFDISFEHYLAIPAFSNSWAGYLDECPAILKYHMDNPSNKETPATKLGKIVHEAVFEPDSFALKKNIAIAPNFGRSKIELEAKARFYHENKGKTVVDAEEYEEAVDISQSVLTKKTSKSLLSNIKSEVTIVWNCIETGALCKGRIDAWDKEAGVVIDLKTTSDSLHDHSLERVLNARKYYRQLAWYSWGLDLLGHPPESQIFIFVQKRKPYPVVFRALDFSACEQGKREMRVLLARYAECLKSGKWPSYSDAVKIIKLPQFAQKYEAGIADFNLYTDAVHEELVASDSSN